MKLIRLTCTCAAFALMHAAGLLPLGSIGAAEARAEDIAPKTAASELQSGASDATDTALEMADRTWDFDQVLQYGPQYGGQTDTAAALAEILRQPEYLESTETESQPSWLEQLLDRLQGWLTRLGMPQSGPWGTVMAVLLAFLLLAVAVRLLWGLLSRQLGRNVKQYRGTASVTADADLLALSRKAAAQGKYRDAVRLRYLALLQQLGLPAATLQTNWQLLRRVAQTCPQAQDAFAALVTSYEDAWYGAQPCFSSEYESSDRLATSIQDLVKSAEAG